VPNLEADDAGAGGTDSTASNITSKSEAEFQSTFAVVGEAASLGTCAMLCANQHVAQMKKPATMSARAEIRLSLRERFHSRFVVFINPLGVPW
jgi:hypothetical protein